MWDVLKHLKSKNTTCIFDEFFDTIQWKQQQNYGHQKHSEKTVKNAMMKEAQAMPDKIQEMCKNKTKLNTLSFSVEADVEQQKCVVNQVDLSLQNAVFASMQFIATAAEMN